MNLAFPLGDELDGIMAEAADAGFFPSLCTFQKPKWQAVADAETELSDSGAPSGEYADIEGLINIPCTAPPFGLSNIQATEFKTVEQIAASEPKHVLLNGYYPQVESGVAVGWRAVIDGTAYDVLGAESDSHGIMTRVRVRLEVL